MKENNLLEISGLWINETKDGTKYFSGRMGNAKVLIFKNKFKEKDNQPDYKMYLTAWEQKDGGPGKSGPAKEDDYPF